VILDGTSTDEIRPSKGAYPRWFVLNLLIRLFQIAPFIIYVFYLQQKLEARSNVSILSNHQATHWKDRCYGIPALFWSYEYWFL